ncbi:hypothetical protein FEM48_Zijuj03G0076200 [Ziziphus jujuba var. spinosa]|uniref:PRONE domain-containing protein n=1 Tax=Ziziphus jujuba var. spinosa TaxID=714518 RepID=A0A978VP07_ZIZJJ|nr:hypothetical protein FEM48_Zijuj03G0076200 [Ziziphus jujuba var. spinosa]
MNQILKATMAINSSVLAEMEIPNAYLQSLPKVKGFAGNMHRNKLLAYRLETLLQNLKMWFPGLPRTTLDMSKIQYNKDVGQSIFESYSNVMESLAFNIMARIDDLLYIDDATKQHSASESITLYDQGRFGGTLPRRKQRSPSPFSIQHTSCASPITLPASYPRN